MIRIRPYVAPAPQALGAPTGVRQLDSFLASTPGKLVTAGAIAAAAAKSFPGKTVAPFVLGVMASLMTGLVPDVKIGA